jgi:hypothetical protein
MAPDRQAVSISIGTVEAIDQKAIDQKSHDKCIDNADGGDFGRGRDAFDHGVADHKGQRDGGQGDAESPHDLTGARPSDMAQILAAVAPPHQHRQRDRQHDARQQTPGKQGCDRNTGHRADRDQHQARRNGFGLGAGGREQRHEIAGFGATRFHFRKQHRRHGGHIGSFGA